MQSNIAMVLGRLLATYERSTPIGLLRLGLAGTRKSYGLYPADLNDLTSADTFLHIPIGNGCVQIAAPIQPVEKTGFYTSDSSLSSSALVIGVRFFRSFAK